MALLQRLYSSCTRESTYHVTVLIIITVSPTPQKTFFDNVKSSLASPLFTADLKKGKPGSYDFGYIDASKHTGAISYVNVKSSRGFWEFTGSGYQVGTGSFVSLSIDGIADTGTTLLLLPAAVVKAYYAKVSGASYNSAQGGYVIPCSATLPNLVLGIGSYRATIPGSYINYAAISGSSKFQARTPERVTELTNGTYRMLWWSSVECGYRYQHLWRYLPQGTICCL